MSAAAGGGPTGSDPSEERAAPPAARSSIGGISGSSSSPDKNEPPPGEQLPPAPHSEDLLARTWRSVVLAVVQISNKTQKVASDGSRESVRELSEATIQLLRQRHEWSRSIAYLEAKLQGKAAEMEALQHYVRCQPKIGGRKRKREEEETNVDNSAAATDSDAAAAAAAAGDAGATQAT